MSCDGLSSNEIVNVGSPSNVTNSFTMDYESIADGSSVNRFRSSAYVTQEATALLFGLRGYI